MKIRVNKGPFECECIICPNCQAHELLNCHIPSDEHRWQIRPFKVDNWSHCLICGCWFNLQGVFEGKPAPYAYSVFSNAREHVTRLNLSSNQEKMSAFVKICRENGLKMENWSEKFDEKQVDIMARGYGLV